MTALTQLLSLPVLASTEELPQVFIIPHTHWEGAVFKTREGYLEVGLPNILKALELLKKYPEYRFVLDQMCYVRPFLERYPAEEAAFRRFLAEGRLQIAGGTDSMHDTNVPSGESIVRQYLLGKSYFRERLGYEVTTGWALDTFGHNAQMPQILKLAGMKTYWLGRGVPGDTPSEFVWQGLDGTQIPAFWLPIWFAPAYGLPANDIEFSNALRRQFDRLTPFTRGSERVLMAGSDVAEPEESLPLMLRKFNASATAPFQARFAIPADFEARVAQRSPPPVVRGEFNPIFAGTYSSRIEVKQTLRDMERLLATAEKLSAIASVTGASSRPEIIEQAWEPVLFNQAHDLAAGVMTDEVYEDSMRSFDYARRLIEAEIHHTSTSLFQRLNTAGPGVPIVVFNSLDWPRSDMAEVTVGLSDVAVREITLLDPDGQPVSAQVLQVLRNADGGIRQARIAFIARNVPALGHAVYRAVPNATMAPAVAGSVRQTRSHDQGTMENEFYRASFDLRSGAMTSLVLKENQSELWSGAANVVAREYDGGDVWALQGMVFSPENQRIGPPKPGSTQWSHDYNGGATSNSGPVFSEFQFRHALGKNAFATRVRMYTGLRRIDIRTELTNQEELVRYRAVFPTTIAKGSVVEEIPFGALERPQDREFPAQNWITYGDGKEGLTLINRGIPGHNVSEGKVMLSLMRSARLTAPNAFEPDPGMKDHRLLPSDSGLGIGQAYTFEYALMPHQGVWSSAAPWRAGLEFNHPLIAQTVAPHEGILPARWGLLELSHENVVISALKPSRDGAVILRVYEAAGKATRGVRISSYVRITRVQEANLIEDVGAELETSDDGFVFDLKPFEIKTFRLMLERTR